MLTHLRYSRILRCAWSAQLRAVADLNADLNARPSNCTSLSAVCGNPNPQYFHHGSGSSETVGAAYGAEYRFHKNEKVKFEIWDTAGSERYESWLPLYMRESTAAVVCYDLTNAAHWEKAKKYVDEIKLRVEGCRIYLVGTKLDIIQKQGRVARQVDYHDAVDYADSARATCVLETSSLTGYNVVEVFDRIFNDCAADVVREFRETRTRQKGAVRLGTDGRQKKCCV